MAANDDRVDALYALPLEQFVAARDALAKALRAEGDRPGSAEVRALTKPTRAAWAVNMAVRAEPEAARALSDSARLLAEAQSELLAGGDAAALHEAGRRAWAAVDALVAAAPDVGAATLDGVRATLHAATADPEVLAAVSAGRVLREQVASGFAGLPAAAADAPKSASAPRARGRARAGAATKGSGEGDVRRRTKKAEAEREAAERERARRQEKLRRAKEAEAAAEQDLAAAERALEQVASALSERRAEVRDARAKLKDAQRRRSRAER